MAAIKFLQNVDLVKNELQNAKIQNLATAPSSPVEGQVYVDTALGNVLRFYNGTAWITLGTLDQISAPAADVAMATHKITGLGTPTSGTDASTKTYVDGQTLNGIATRTAATADVDLATHKLINVVAPSSGTDAANKTYVDGQTLNGIATRTASTADITVSGFKITNLGTPSSGTDAVTKTYADSLVAGISSWKTAVRAATTATGTLATAYANSSVIDGVTLATGDRILIKNQTSGGENGVYLVAASGAPTRTTDSDAGSELIGAAVFVDEGTTNADSSWVNTTNGPITIGTTATVWVQFSGAGQITSGAGLTKTGNTLDVGAGTGITVAADSVGIDTSVTVDKTTAQTLTNKTLTSPAITTPTGIVKGDVGLGNVDNTADSAKTFNASAITAGTLVVGRGGTGVTTGTGTGANVLGTSPNITTPTGIVASDVGAQPVDSDLTTIAGLTATTDSFLQSKSSAWTTRTVAQVKTDLGLTGTNSGDVTAGTGISVASQVVSIDTSVVVRKYAVDVGDGSTTSIVITHNLGTLDVQVTLYDKTTPFSELMVDKQHTSTNTVTLVFTVAPTSAQYRVVVQG